MNSISITTPPLNTLFRRQFYDLEATIDVMQHLWQARAVDGFEFQNLAEWDATAPPREKAERRIPAWQASKRYSIDALALRLQMTKLPILSVHANRDAGIYLCGNTNTEINRAKRLIDESLSLTKQLGCTICVFHLWDTWKQIFDPNFIKRILDEVKIQYPEIRAAVENIPTNLKGLTPFELVKEFDHITLDLRWAAMYDELDNFESVKNRIINVHLRARLEGTEWIIHNAPFTLSEALNTIQNKWQYSGLLTVEPEGGLTHANLNDLITALRTLRPR